MTTLSLGVGYMVFNDYIAPAPELAGRWKFTVVYEETALPRFERLKVTCQAQLIQEGLELSGAGEKLSDRGSAIEPVDYDSGQRANIDVMGNVTRNYFSPDALALRYREAGRRRDSSTLHELEYFRRGDDLRLLPVDDRRHGRFDLVGACRRARPPLLAGAPAGGLRGVACGAAR